MNLLHFSARHKKSSFWRGITSVTIAGRSTIFNLLINYSNGTAGLQVDSSMSKKFYLDPYTIYGWCTKKRLQNKLDMIIITVLNTKTTHTHVHEKLD